MRRAPYGAGGPPSALKLPRPTGGGRLVSSRTGIKNALRPVTSKKTSIVIVVGVLLLATWYVVLGARPRSVSFAQGELRAEAALPFFRESLETEQYTIHFDLAASALSPRHYWVYADECLLELRINDVVVADPRFPLCDWGRSFEFDLGPYLRHGTNRLSAVVKNLPGSGAFNLEAADSDRRLILFRLYAMLVAGFLALALARAVGFSTSIGSCFAAGVLLRVYYFFVTPYRTRAHDVDGHIEHLRFVAETFSIPAPHDGWQFHQPPLYYFLAGGIARVSELIGISPSQLPDTLQLFSLLLSCGALLLGIGIGRLLAEHLRAPGAQVPFAALLACTPSLVFSASRISNDTLFHLLAFACAFCLIRWWRSGKGADFWVAAGLLVPLWLTKASAAPVAASLAAAVLLHPSVAFNTRLQLLGGGGVLLGVTALIHHVIRTALHGSFALSEKFQALHHGLRVEDDLSRFFVFSPRALLALPFNNPWADEARRGYFWEYLFRSALFGEFQYNPSFLPLARVVVALTLVLLVAALIGAWRAWRKDLRTCALLLAVLASHVGVLIAFSCIYPYAPHQDFRFIHLAVVPVGFFAALAASGESKALAPLRLAVWLQISASELFVLLLWNHGFPP